MGITLVRTFVCVLIVASLGLAALALATTRHPPPSEVCVTQSAVLNAEGQLVSQDFPQHPDAKLKSGYYHAIYVREGWVVGGLQADPANPNLLCILKVTVNNGTTSIECSRPPGRGCSTTCTLEQDGGQNGATKYSCACSNRP